MTQNNLIEQLQKASLFQLWRLRALIDKMLNDPYRLDSIRRTLSVGQKVTYFEPDKNRDIAATVVEIFRTYVLVKNDHDLKQWKLPFYMLNLDNLEIHFNLSPKSVDRLTLKEGDQVGFINHKDNNKQLCGIVTKLNPKTATIRLSSGEYWRVVYNALFYVLDAK